MKKILFTIIAALFVSNYVYSQEVAFIKGKGYEGYIFPKEHSIWGFPPEKGRYTPSLKDIAKAEKILSDNFNADYIKQNQTPYSEPPINRKTLKKYVRQYVGYLTDDNEIIIHINLFKKGKTENQSPSLDIISAQDGGHSFWRIQINITTKEIFNINVNGIS